MFILSNRCGVLVLPVSFNLATLSDSLRNLPLFFSAAARGAVVGVARVRVEAIRRSTFEVVGLSGPASDAGQARTNCEFGLLVEVHLVLLSRERASRALGAVALIALRHLIRLIRIPACFSQFVFDYVIRVRKRP